jgi:ribosomal protein S18 acetylase RimI-like enzyme
MNLTEIRIETAKHDSRVSDDANSILAAFGHAGSSQVRGEPDKSFADSCFFLNNNEEEAYVAVGYLGKMATVAAVFLREIKQPHEFMQPEELPYLYLPSISLTLIASDVAYRRQGHGRQLVNRIVELAAKTGNNRVQAIWPSDENAISFWKSCGFQELPYLTFGGDLAKDTSIGINEPISSDVKVVIEPGVVQGLSRQLS